MKKEIRSWEAGGKTKIIFPDSLTGGEWWRIYNPKNEMTVLAKNVDEARMLTDALNQYRKTK